MANEQRLSKKKLNAAGTLYTIVGAVLTFLSICGLIMFVSTDMGIVGILGSGFCLLVGIGLVVLGMSFHKKAKSALTDDELAQLAREDAERARQLLTEPDIKKEGAVFSVKGVRGRNLYVFEDKCIINTTAGVGSFLTGNATDGEKTIYYADVIGVQYKPSGINIGYLQLETASSMMNNRNSNYFNENSFTFDPTTVSNERMAEIAEYVKKCVDEVKRSSSAQVVQQAASEADELKKFKELLDAGVLTQEEFNEKKKQLLGL